MWHFEKFLNFFAYMGFSLPNSHNYLIINLVSIYVYHPLCVVYNKTLNLMCCKRSNWHQGLINHDCEMISWVHMMVTFWCFANILNLITWISSKHLSSAHLLQEQIWSTFSICTLFPDFVSILVTSPHLFSSMRSSHKPLKDCSHVQVPFKKPPYIK
jgi:hypothetical protein